MGPWDCPAIAACAAGAYASRNAHSGCTYIQVPYRSTGVFLADYFAGL